MYPPHTDVWKKHSCLTQLSQCPSCVQHRVTGAVAAEGAAHEVDRTQRSPLNYHLYDFGFRSAALGQRTAKSQLASWKVCVLVALLPERKAAQSMNPCISMLCSKMPQAITYNAAINACKGKGQVETHLVALKQKLSAAVKDARDPRLSLPLQVGGEWHFRCWRRAKDLSYPAPRCLSTAC